MATNVIDAARALTNKLCEMYGLDPLRVLSAEIVNEPDEVLHVVFEHEMSEVEAAQACVEAKRLGMTAMLKKADRFAEGLARAEEVVRRFQPASVVSHTTNPAQVFVLQPNHRVVSGDMGMVIEPVPRDEFNVGLGLRLADDAIGVMGADGKVELNAEGRRVFGNAELKVQAAVDASSFTCHRCKLPTKGRPAAYVYDGGLCWPCAEAPEAFKAAGIG